MLYPELSEISIREGHWRPIQPASSWKSPAETIARWIPDHKTPLHTRAWSGQSDNEWPVVLDDTSSSGLAEIEDAIEGSRWILELPDDWDELGSPRYDEETWMRAAHLLRLLAEGAYDIFSHKLPIPRISPADENSIDLFWENPRRNLLINIPWSRKEKGSYYGSSATAETISGTVDPDRRRLDLIAWLLHLE